MKKVLLLLLLSISLCMQAQVTVGVGEAANQSALLELRENTDGTSNRGLLLPRVKLSSLMIQLILSAPNSLRKKIKLNLEYTLVCFFNVSVLHI